MIGSLLSISLWKIGILSANTDKHSPPAPPQASNVGPHCFKRDMVVSPIIAMYALNSAPCLVLIHERRHHCITAALQHDSKSVIM